MQHIKSGHMKRLVKCLNKQLAAYPELYSLPFEAKIESEYFRLESQVSKTLKSKEFLYKFNPKVKTAWDNSAMWLGAFRMMDYLERVEPR